MTNAIPSDDQRRVRFRRFIAGLIDLAIAFLLGIAIFLAGRRYLILIIARRATMFIVPLVYLMIKDSIGGKSIGKLATGLRVWNDNENRPGNIFDSIIRNWYLAIPVLGPTLIAAVIGAQILAGWKQRIGDGWAGTSVIKD
jgi:uncharacterized RDD family membrane protein YckC